MSFEAGPAPDDRAVAIARAERRLRMIERLSEAGLKAAEYLARRASAPEVGDEAARDGLAFAKVARAVRLGVILETKLDEQILALRGGAPLHTVAWIAAPGSAGQPLVRARLEDPTTVVERERSGEPAIERDGERLPTGGFRDWTQAICDGLGLDTDRTSWSDDEGFVHEDGQPVAEWRSRYLVEPEGEDQTRPPTSFHMRE